MSITSSIINIRIISILNIFPFPIIINGEKGEPLTEEIGESSLVDIK